jgi:hypothetical protein
MVGRNDGCSSKCVPRTASRTLVTRRTIPVPGPAGPRSGFGPPSTFSLIIYLSQFQLQLEYSFIGVLEKRFERRTGYFPVTLKNSRRPGQMLALYHTPSGHRVATVLAVRLDPQRSAPFKSDVSVSEPCDILRTGRVNTDDHLHKLAADHKDCE